MAYVPSTDKRPVYLDSLGQPMASGKLVYTDTATIPVAKTIYVDTLDTEGANPQDLDASGRTATEIFLDTGDYRVTAYRFTGVDPIVEPFPGPTWVLDHSWLEEGRAVVGPVDPTSILNVPTMAALALVDPVLYQRVNVLGYYEEGDVGPRFFEWDPNNALNGNLGTIVKYGTSTLGSWVHSIGNTDHIDVRVFGALPGGIVARNSNIAAACYYISNGGGSPRSLYFPSGTYAVAGDTLQYFNCPVRIDAAVYFRNVAPATTYSLQFNSSFDISKTDAFCSGLSAPGSVVDLVFAGTGIDDPTVRDCWWHFGPKTSVDNYELFNRIVTQVPVGYTIVTTGRYSFVTSIPASIVVPQHLRFEGMGRIESDLHTQYVEFVGTGGITNNTWITAPGQLQTVRGVLLPGSSGTQQFKFTNCPEVRSSWFATDNGDQKTLDLCKAVLACGDATPGTKFVFDHPRNVFSSTGLLAEQGMNYVFAHESGVVERSGTTPTSQVVMTNCDFGGEYFISGPGFVVGGQVNNISNWVPPAPTAADINKAWKYSLESALTLDGILDLCGNSVPLSDTTVLNRANMASALVRNGTLTLDNNYTILSIAGAIDTLRFENVTVSSTANTPLVQVTTGGSIEKLILEQLQFNSSGSACDMIVTSGSGTIGVLDIGHCVTSCSNVVNALTGILNINVHDNGSLTGDLITDQCCVLASNNKITGGAYGMWKMACYDSVVVTGNRFYQCDLWIYDKEGTVDAVVNGNQFESTDTKWSRIIYYARTINTHFTGAIATGNSFTGSLTTGMVAIMVGSPDVMGYEYTQGQKANYWSNRRMVDFGYTPLKHQICLTGNTSSNINIIVPVTRGPVPGGYMDELGNNSLVYTLGADEHDLGFYFSQNPGVFYLPGSDPEDTISSLVVTPIYMTSIDGTPLTAIPMFMARDVQIRCWDLNTNDDVVYTRYNCHFATTGTETKIAVASTRTWGMNICLYSGQPFPNY